MTRIILALLLLLYCCQSTVRSEDESTAVKQSVGDSPFQYIDVGKKIPIYTAGEKWGTQAEPRSLMQLPLSPEESMKRLMVPEGFRVELFASEPDLDGKPIAMTWDERGRLWIAETIDYPNELEPSGVGRDRIRICEDTDADGRADQFTVFAEGLSVPAALVHAQGGLIVQNGHETLFLKDTDGDDRADERKVLISGWGIEDTHAGVSNFQYGLDNHVWAVQGYNRSQPVALGKPQQSFRMGFFRFPTDGSAVEFIRPTDNNTWGLGFSEEGLVFGSTANHNPSVFMGIPNRYYERVRGWTPQLVLPTIADTHLFKAPTDKVRQMDHHGGYTAGAGHALYTARNYPQEYWNRTAFVCEPTGHLIGMFELTASGAGFKAHSPFNLLGSDDEWTAPTMAEVGPDGNVWVIDWYNFIVQHNPTPLGFETGRRAAYETDLRDKKHGRIYRIVHNGSQPEAAMSLSIDEPHKLVDALQHPTMLWRKHAQRLLVERGQLDVVDDLIRLIKDGHVDEIGLNVGAIHALWTLHGLGVLDGANSDAINAVYDALEHRSPGVRRNAVQVLPIDLASAEKILQGQLLKDSDAQVRLAALLALADQPAIAAAGPAIAEVLSSPSAANDNWLVEAATCAAANNASSFLQSLASLEKSSTKLAGVAETVAGHFARSQNWEDLESILGSVAEYEVGLAEAVIRGFDSGWPNSKDLTLTPASDEYLEKLAERVSPRVRGSLIRLATQWSSTRLEGLANKFVDSLLDDIRNADLPEPRRIELAKQLIEFAPERMDSAEALLELIEPRTSPELAQGLLQALALSTNDKAAASLVSKLAAMTPGVRATATNVLLGRAAWTQQLLAAASERKFDLGELPLPQREALQAHPDRRLRERALKLLEAGGSLPSADRQQVLSELLPLVEQRGDPALGKALFTKHCGTCHRHSGEGGTVGPDLTGMAAHPKAELLTNIIDPNRSVEGNYRVYNVVTVEGQVLSGLLASESRTAIELVDAEGKRISLLREDIDQLVGSSKSLMPEGFEKQINANEMVHLLEFLAQRGRFLPLDLRSVATVSSVRGMFNSLDAQVERLVFNDWGAKTIGEVPFALIDPRDGNMKNAIVLNSPLGELASTMPKSVTLPCNAPLKAIHMLSGVSGWGFPFEERGATSLIIRLHFEDSSTEDIPLQNGVHFADYIRRVDVPESEFAFDLNGRQIRYLKVSPERADTITNVELLKGDDRTAPVVMAITLEGRD